jgi:tape measure domain-containing protein
MASLGDLVVKIGADTRDLNKQLGKVQREVRGMTSNITNLGKNMTRSITLPLAALGAAAVKSAADLETLETSFISLTGGAKQARDMVADLNKFTAETPFQLEAVGKAARQLIAAGTDISEVNMQLQFLGDIAATSGSSIDEIAAIFAKVQAKGKVELENLNQLAERGIPIFTALSEATGLLPSELGAGSVSVQQFNETLKSFAEEGGFANGAMQRLSETAAGRFSTALDNLKLAGAELGNVLLPTINKLLEFVTDLAQRFTALNGSTQQMIVEMGLAAAAIGPLVILIPQIITQITALRGAFALLNTVLIANPIGAVIASIVALTAVVVTFRNRTGDATAENDKFVRSLRDLDQQAQINHVKEQIRELERERNSIRAAQRAEMAAQAAGALGDRLDKQVARGSATKYGEQVKFLDERIEGLVMTVREMNAEIGTNTPRVVEEATTKTRIYADEMQRLEVNTVATEQAAKTLQQTTWNVGDMIDNTTGQVDQMGVAMVNAFSNATASAQSFAGFAIQAIKGVLIAYLAEAKARVIANSAEGAAGTGPAYPFVMAGLLGAGMALINKIPIPALAEGGLASGPTMAIVGDNRNAAIDPEVISPLSKLKDMMGGSQVEVFGRISGNDIFLSNSRSGFKRNRYS